MKVVVGTSYLQFNLGLHGGILRARMTTTPDTSYEVIAQNYRCRTVVTRTWPHRPTQHCSLGVLRYLLEQVGWHDTPLACCDSTYLHQRGFANALFKHFSQSAGFFNGWKPGEPMPQSG